MRGKYSPTVNQAYRKDQDWYRKYADSAGNRYPFRDPEGFDQYGYDESNIDRAGNYEWDYYPNDCPHPENADYNIAYDKADSAWGFDGVKPVKTS